MWGSEQRRGVNPSYMWRTGRGNGNPFQYSCLEDPMDWGAWWLPSTGPHWSDWAHGKRIPLTWVWNWFKRARPKAKRLVKRLCDNSGGRWRWFDWVLVAGVLRRSEILDLFWRKGQGDLLIGWMWDVRESDDSQGFSLNGQRMELSIGDGERLRGEQCWGDKQRHWRLQMWDITGYPGCFLILKIIHQREQFSFISPCSKDIAPWEWKLKWPFCVNFCACLVASVTSDSFETPWTVACQAARSMGFSRQKYWSGLPCPPPRQSFWHRDRTSNSCIACIAGILYHTDFYTWPFPVVAGHNFIALRQHLDSVLEQIELLSRPDVCFII